MGFENAGGPPFVPSEFNTARNVPEELPPKVPNAGLGYELPFPAHSNGNEENNRPAPKEPTDPKPTELPKREPGKASPPPGRPATPYER